MATVKTVNGVALASIKTYNGLAIASVKTINGMDAQTSSGSWVESVAYGSTTSTDTIDPDLERGAPLVADQSGNVTKLSFGLVGWSSSINLKMAIFRNSDGVPIGGETFTIPSDPGNGRYEVTLTTPVAVTNGTTYVVTVVCSTSQNILRYLPGLPSGSGKYASTTYAGFPDNPTTFSDITQAWSVGMFIEP